MALTISFVLLFSLLTISLAVEVTVYDQIAHRFNKGSHKPLTVSQLPWEFEYYLEQFVHIEVGVKMTNKSPSVTAHIVTYSTHGVTKYVGSQGPIKYYDNYGNVLKSAEFYVKLDLYKYTVLCSTLIVAQGRTDWSGNEKPLYHNICPNSCTLVVDISDECVDPPLDTESRTTTTLNPVFNNVASNTNATTTVNTTIIIISSTIGVVVVVVLLVVIAVWKYCCKRNTSGTHQPSDPFYLNMLFRKECDQEIAEIEQHQYEEIEEHQNEQTENQYEEIYL